MKIVPFKIPKSTNETFRVQIDKIPYLYNHLHQHPEIQLTLIKESEGTLIAGDYVGRFKEKDVFVVGSDQPHVFRNDDKYFKKKFRAFAISIFFDDSTLGSFFWQLPEARDVLSFFRNSSTGFKITGKKQIQIAEHLEKLVTTKGLDKLILFLEIIKLLSTKKEMIPLSAPYSRKTIKTFDGNRLNEILEFTFKESHRSIKLEEIAKIANLTPEAFCKYFKTRTRKTYISFLNEIRISNACKLFMNEDLQVSSVCYEVGFNNLSNFNRIFKKVTGKAPKEYVKT
ncbi:MAG: AraC family transcriptional regulator, partial [Bacteroidota bacterium]|nr:AraC family transcriptional regulator [Bacteroidota bacterium]